MAINSLFSKVNEIDSSKDYWLIRTDGGLYFDTFYDNDFIGINWNYLTIEDIRKGEIEKVKAKIAKKEEININDPKGRSKVTMIYNKVTRFLNLNQGDRIMIPSINSDRYAFGIIDDEIAYVENDQMKSCPHRKRRKVKWLQNIAMVDLDPIFYKIRMSRHAISEVDEYSAYLDRTMDSLFYKNGDSHLVLDFRSTLDVDIDSLANLSTGLKKLLIYANDDFNLGEDVSQSFVKINLQSPGTLEVIQRKGRALVIVAAALFMTADGNEGEFEVPANAKKEIETFVDAHPQEIEEMRELLKKYEQDRKKVNNTALDGGN